MFLPQQTLGQWRKCESHRNHSHIPKSCLSGDHNYTGRGWEGKSRLSGAGRWILGVELEKRNPRAGRANAKTSVQTTQHVWTLTVDRTAAREQTLCEKHGIELQGNQPILNRKGTPQQHRGSYGSRSNWNRLGYSMPKRHNRCIFQWSQSYRFVKNTTGVAKNRSLKTPITWLWPTFRGEALRSSRGTQNKSHSFCIRNQWLIVETRPLTDQLPTMHQSPSSISNTAKK